MPAIRQNKLIPLLAMAALVIVGFTFWHISRDGATAMPAGKPLETVPTITEPDGTNAPATGFLSTAKNVRTTSASADADTPTETIRTLTAEVAAMRNDMQHMGNENRQLQINKDQLKAEIKSELQASQMALSGTPTATPTSSTVTSSRAPADAKASPAGMEGGLDQSHLLAQLPAGFGFEKGAGLVTGAGGEVATAAPTSAATTRTVLPMGVTLGKGGNGQDSLIRTSFPATSIPRGAIAPQTDPNAPQSGDLSADARGGARAGTPAIAVKKDQPYFTIPENATLMGATAMTAIVGRIPVDGRVQDPMQFKLLLGPNNLAANGFFLPRDLSGIVVSGIAIGDMNLSCSEGIIQSMTFVFNDGAIRTVSMRSNGGGAMSVLGGSLGGGQGSQAGLVQTAKLGYLSDRYGNPCIAGEFKTNAPEYLATVIGLKSLSLAGKAAAMAQTSTTSSTGFGGASTSSVVTGSKGAFILGETAAGATDEVTSWITRRMSNSFDAVVTMAGADVVVHVDQAIAIDKTVDARFLDYDQDNSASPRTLGKGTRYGLD
jgi:integrating conjugative element protein (TIGR03752 family)